MVAMLLGGGCGSRSSSIIISHLHLRDCDYLHQFHFPPIPTFKFTSSSALQFHQTFHLSLPSPPSIIGLGLGLGHHLNRMPSSSTSRYSSTTPSISSPHIPFIFYSSTQRDGEHENISDRISTVAGGIVALGKFDALHIGHRELAIQASRAGPPFLLSFVGMAKVLGWEPRAPIVAKCDRKRVLSSWVPYCNNMIPEEFEVEFSSVRHLTPRQFVEKLSKELGVRGVVAGENYRFGYKAAGDALELVKLCEEYGLEAYIIKSVMDKNQSSANINSSIKSKEKGQVSSTRVREALAVGDMKYVSELLGRQHRLILMANDQDRFGVCQYKVSAPRSCLLNLAPKEGLYEKCYLILDQENVMQCRVVIDNKFVHVEADHGCLSDTIGAQSLQFLQIEFGDSST